MGKYKSNEACWYFICRTVETKNGNSMEQYQKAGWSFMKGLWRQDNGDFNFNYYFENFETV